MCPGSPTLLLDTSGMLPLDGPPLIFVKKTNFCFLMHRGGGGFQPSFILISISLVKKFNLHLAPNISMMCHIQSMKQFYLDADIDFEKNLIVSRTNNLKPIISHHTYVYSLQDLHKRAKFNNNKE